MEQRLANSKALGFLGLAVTAWVYSMPTAHWFSVDMLGGATAEHAAVFAMIAMFIAGLVAFVRGEGWYGVFFVLGAAYWWGVHAAAGAAAGATLGFNAWFWVVLALAFLILFASALRARLPLPVTLVTLGITLIFLFLALFGWVAPFFQIVAGYVGLATALVAFWAAYAELPHGAEISAAAAPAL